MVGDQGASPSLVADVASVIVEHLKAVVELGAGAEATEGEGDEGGEGVGEPAAGAGSPRPLGSAAFEVVPGGGGGQPRSSYPVDQICAILNGVLTICSDIGCFKQYCNVKYPTWPDKIN